MDRRIRKNGYNFLIITILNFSEGASQQEVYVPLELIQGLSIQLTYYSVGCIVLGSVLGYFIYHKAALGVQTTKPGAEARRVNADAFPASWLHVRAKN